ncbi:MAG: hypothetical protein J0I12_02940 [Candidatus Eremiobacteraeota bacterium]|nr:hypothetical protein [Candidatus Eremiobacteraeota bacterium]
MKFPVMNPFQLNEVIIDQSVKAMQNWVKVAEQGEKMTAQVLEFNKKNREESLKLIEASAEQFKQSTRLFTDLFDKMLSFQVQNYQQASKATVEQFNKQVAQFSKQ